MWGTNYVRTLSLALKPAKSVTAVTALRVYLKRHKKMKERKKEGKERKRREKRKELVPRLCPPPHPLQVIEVLTSRKDCIILTLFWRQALERKSCLGFFRGRSD